MSAYYNQKRDPILTFFNILPEMSKEDFKPNRKGFFVISSEITIENPFRPTSIFKFMDFAVIRNNSGEINFKQYNLNRFKKNLEKYPHKDTELGMLVFKERSFRYRRFQDMIFYFDMFDKRTHFRMRDFNYGKQIFLEIEINKIFSLVICEFNCDLYDKKISYPSDFRYLILKGERLPHLEVIKEDLLSNYLDIQKEEHKTPSKEKTLLPSQISKKVYDHKKDLKFHPKNDLTLDQQKGEVFEFCPTCGNLPFNCICGVKKDSADITDEIKISGKDNQEEGVEIKKPEENAETKMKRKGTIHIKKHGFDIIKKLNRQENWTIDDLKSKLKLNDYEIRILHKMQLLGNTNRDDYFIFSQNEKQNFIFHVNRGKIIDYSVQYYEENFLEPLNYYRYLRFHYEVWPSDKADFVKALIDISSAYLDRISIWEEIGSNYGIILDYLKIDYYLKILESLNYEQTIEEYFKQYMVDDLRSKKNEIIKLLKSHSDLRRRGLFDELSDHFKVCQKSKCEQCGGNLLNIILISIEKVRNYFTETGIIEKEIQKVSKIAYCNDINILEKYEKNLEVILEDFKDVEAFTVSKGLDWSKRFNKKNIESLKLIITEYFFMNFIYSTLSSLLKYKKILMIYDSEKSDKILITLFKEYKKTAQKLKKLRISLIDSDPLKRIISKGFEGNISVFRNHDSVIKKLGRWGEKQVYNWLKEVYQNRTDAEVIWVNEDSLGSGTENPYDITVKFSEKVEYIEVKTSHSNDKTFTMSERELNFALKNNLSYKIILITNASEKNSVNYEVIEDIAAKLENDTLRIHSRKFSLN